MYPTILLLTVLQNPKSLNLQTTQKLNTQLKPTHAQVVSSTPLRSCCPLTSRSLLKNQDDVSWIVTVAGGIMATIVIVAAAVSWQRYHYATKMVTTAASWDQQQQRQLHGNNRDSGSSSTKAIVEIVAVPAVSWDR